MRMTFISLMIFLTIPSLAQAHCPNPTTVEGTTYCFDIQWQRTSQRNGRDWATAREMSPHLNPMRARERALRYSNVQIVAWEKGQGRNSGLNNPRLRVFPYMTMNNGHHHGASHAYRRDGQRFFLSYINFVQMPGCWMIRATEASNHSLVNSELVLQLNTFANGQSTDCR